MKVTSLLIPVLFFISSTKARDGVVLHHAIVITIKQKKLQLSQ